MSTSDSKQTVKRTGTHSHAEDGRMTMSDELARLDTETPAQNIPAKDSEGNLRTQPRTTSDGL